MNNGNAGVLASREGSFLEIREILALLLLRYVIMYCHSEMTVYLHGALSAFYRWILSQLNDVRLEICRVLPLLTMRKANSG